MGGDVPSKASNDYYKLLQQYQILQEISPQGIKYLQHKVSKQQYLLRQLSSHDKISFQKTIKTLQQKLHLLQNNKHVVSLKRIIHQQSAQYCTTIYRLYALFQFPQRTLQDQINQRIIQKRHFQQNEIWSILASCVLGMSHLQKHNIIHNTLRSNSILINPKGNIKIYDPITTGTSSNYELVLSRRNQPHIYLSPQEVECLKMQKIKTDLDPYKSDIWTIAIIMLQAGLLQYQDSVYRDQLTRIHWQTLQYNLNRFLQTHSSQLTNLLQFMLAKNPEARPNWSDMQLSVIKGEESCKNSIIISQLGDKKIKSLRDSKTLLRSPKHQEQNLFQVFEQQQPRTKSNIPIQNKIDNYGAVFKNYLQRSRVFPSSIHNIQQTRPLKNMFPNPQYHTVTQPDDYKQNSKSQHSTQQLPVFSRKQQKLQSVTQRYMQGSMYVGTKLNGLKHGLGKFFYQDGGRYEGMWYQDKMEGLGKLFYQSQRLAYDGDWKRDQFNGKGILYNQFPTNLNQPFNYRNFNEVEDYWTKYEGEFVQDMKHGKGKLYLSNGQWLQAEFKNDFANGAGVFHTKSKTKVRGLWINNILQ